MRGLHLARGAGRARGHRDAVEVEGDHGGFGLDARQAAKSVVFGSLSASAPKMTACGVMVLRPGFQPVAQRPHAGDIRSERLQGGLGGGAEARNPGNILGAGPRPALLPAAPDQRLGNVKSRRADQRANALRAAELVRATMSTDQRRAPSMSSAMRPGPCTASTCTRPPASMHDVGGLREPAGSRRFRCWPA